MPKLLRKSMKMERNTPSILFLIPKLGTGGAERQLVALAIGLKRLGYPVKTAVFYEGGALEGDLREAEVPIVILGKGRWGIPIHYYHLVRLLKQEQPKILYSYMSLANDWSVLAKPWASAIRIIWGIRVSKLDLKNYDWQSRMTYQLEGKLARFANKIISNSFSGSEDAVKRGIPKNKICVIPNGIDVEKFKPARASREEFRHEWKVKNTEKLIGLIARLDPMKDHETFLKAAAQLALERKDVRFVCVGSGPITHETRLRKIAMDLNLDNLLIWIGGRQDVQNVYNGLDILVLSSSYGEGFPNVLGEAMACGVPCVVTDVGDSARIVGDTGEVVPPRDPSALKQGMIRMLRKIEKGKRTLSQHCRDRIVNEFSGTKMVQDTVEVIKEIV